MTDKERAEIAPRVRARTKELLATEPVQFIDAWVAKIKAAQDDVEAYALTCAMIQRYRKLLGPIGPITLSATYELAE